VILGTLDAVDENGGDYLLLVDNYDEGINIAAQAKTVDGLLERAASGEVYGRWMIVKLVRVSLREEAPHAE
jgi:predicted deacetylase